MKINYIIDIMTIKKIILSFVLISISMVARSDANPDMWPYIKEKMYKDQVITEVDFLKIDGPKRASSGAQVPINIKLASPEGVNIKKLVLIIDGNPIQLASTYHLTKQTQDLDLSTRIRMETDSFVRVVAEADSGKLYMSVVAIRASGGCSGYMDVHDPALTKDLGKILVKTKAKYLTTRIKHPMFNGLQRDLDSGGYIPQWIVTQVRYNYKGENVLVVENDISISQDPYLKVNFPLGAKGTVTVSATDTKGQIFIKTTEI